MQTDTSLAKKGVVYINYLLNYQTLNEMVLHEVGVAFTKGGWVELNHCRA